MNRKPSLTAMRGASGGFIVMSVSRMLDTDEMLHVQRYRTKDKWQRRRSGGFSVAKFLAHLNAELDKKKKRGSARGVTRLQK